jgi:hypothetical protein
MRCFVLGALVGVLALLVCPALMNWPADAIAAAHVGSLLFAASTALIALLARSL